MINSENFDQFRLLWLILTNDNCEQLWFMWPLVTNMSTSACHKCEHFWWLPATSFVKETISKPIKIYLITFKFQVNKIHVASRGLSLTTCQSCFKNLLKFFVKPTLRLKAYFMEQHQIFKLGFFKREPELSIEWSQVFFERPSPAEVFQTNLIEVFSRIWCEEMRESISPEGQAFRVASSCQ